MPPSVVEGNLLTCSWKDWVPLKRQPGRYSRWFHLASNCLFMLLRAERSIRAPCFLKDWKVASRGKGLGRRFEVFSAPEPACLKSTPHLLCLSAPKVFGYRILAMAQAGSC